jgi:hypothetical protein
MNDFSYYLIEIREGIIPGIPQKTLIGEIFINSNINVSDIVEYDNMFYQVQFRVVKNSNIVNNLIREEECSIELYCVKLSKPYPFIYKENDIN